MEVKQIYELVNATTKEILGETAVQVNEDLTNVVDVGTAVLNANAVENYTKSLIDRIGKTIFVNRPYKGSAPKVLMDGWQYGSVLQKVRADLPDAQENESWELVDGQSYDPNIFKAPKVSNKFYNAKTTFEVQISITDIQFRSAFLNAESVNAFFSMIQTAVETSLTAKEDSLIMRVIDNMIAETMYAEVPGGTYSGRSGAKAVNVLYLYNQATGSSLTASGALYSKEFLRFATALMRKYINRLRSLSKLFNIGATAKFTPNEDLHVVLHNDFIEQATSVLESDTFHDEFVKLPKHEIVNYWQGSGTGYAWADTSKISVKSSENHEVTLSNILGVMFDTWALGVCNKDNRVTTDRTGKAEFTNYYHKRDAHFFNDFDENFVVFYMA